MAGIRWRPGFQPYNFLQQRGNLVSPAPDSALSERHFALFGAIVQCFAHYEELMDEMIAKQGGGSATSVKLIMASLDFGRKLNALFSVLRHRNVVVGHYDKILRFLTVPQTYSVLRGDIVHSVWVKSKSRNAIYPRWLSHGPAQAVRPVHDIDHSAQTFQERPEDEATYTLDDLSDILDILSKNYIEFQRYLVDHSLIDVRPGSAAES